MYKLPDIKPVGFEIFIFKWIFLPALLASVIFNLWSVSSGANNCKSVCKEKGFMRHEYRSVDRYSGLNEACYCLAEKGNKETRTLQSFK